MPFNPPPNWPVTRGWEPPPGWSPDPSWPVAPSGWRFWTDDTTPATAALASPAADHAFHNRDDVGVSQKPLAVTSPARARRVVWAAVALTAIIAAAIALVVVHQSRPTNETAGGIRTAEPASSEATATVTGQGFAATLGAVTVSGPAGVAPEGTVVRVTSAAPALPDQWARIAQPLAQGVEVRFEDDSQPDRPITISFPEVSADGDVFILTQPSSGEPEVVGHTAAGSPVSASVGHLSSFWPIVVDTSKAIDEIFAAASDALEMTSPRPDCFIDGGEYRDLQLRIRDAPTTVVWPCIARAWGGVRLSLHSTSSVAWRVRTEPRWRPAPPTAYSIGNIVALAAWRTGSAQAADEAMLLPGESVEVDTDQAPNSTTVGMLVDPVMSQIRTLALAIAILVPESVAVEKISKAECLTDLVRTAAIDSDPSAGGFAAILGCFGSAIGGAPGALVGLLAAAPAALWGQLEGVLRSATRQDELTFTVASTVDPALSEGPGEAISLAAIESWLGEWTGPVNQSGSKPYSVRMQLSHDGRTVVGTVEYPELGCSGVLDEASLRSDLLKIEETIKVKGTCITTVDLELTLRPGEIGYHFDSGGGGDGVLRRP